MRVEPSVFTAPDSAWAEEDFSNCLSLHTQNMRLGSFSHKLCSALNLIDPDTNYLDLSIYPTSENYRQHADWAYHAAWIPAKYTLEGIADPKRLHYRNTFLAYNNTFFQQRDEGYLKNISSQEKAARKLEIKNNLDNFKTFLREYKEGPSRYNTSINSLKGADYLAVLEGATYQGKPYLTIEGRYKQELRDLFSELYDHRPNISKKDLHFFRSLASRAMGQEGYRYVWSTDPQKI